MRACAKSSYCRSPKSGSGKAGLRGDGGANNPHGCKGKPDNGTNHDNVMIDSYEHPKADQGNSKTYGLRKLRHAATPEIDETTGEAPPRGGAFFGGLARRRRGE